MIDASSGGGVEAVDAGGKANPGSRTAVKEDNRVGEQGLTDDGAAGASVVIVKTLVAERRVEQLEEEEEKEDEGERRKRCSQ